MANRQPASNPATEDASKPKHNLAHTERLRFCTERLRADTVCSLKSVQSALVILTGAISLLETTPRQFINTPMLKLQLDMANELVRTAFTATSDCLGHGVRGVLDDIAPPTPAFETPPTQSPYINCDNLANSSEFHGQHRNYGQPTLNSIIFNQLTTDD